MKKFFEKVKDNLWYLYLSDEEGCGLVWGLTLSVVVVIIYFLGI